jgi:tRNA(Ile)-lysidine synthase
MADTLLARVAGIIHRYSMLSAGDRVGVAVSGGADSVVLLHVLHRLANELRIEPLVLHVNHRLRGAESDADEAFVRELTESLGLAFFEERSQIEDGNLEQAARDARRDFFRRCQGRYNLRRVALGHTRSDQAETVLFRFLRGSGLAGLAGMRMVTNDGLIRPLLNTSRTEVREWAAAEGIKWREDSSNANLEFARNRLRHHTIPMLTQEFNSNLEAVLAGIAELARAEEEYWDEQLGPIYQEIRKRTRLGPILDVDQLATLHDALQRRVIRRAITDLRGDLRSIDLLHVDAILACCRSTQGHQRVLAPGVDALRSFDKLLLTRPGELSARERYYRINLGLGQECKLPFGAGFLCIKSVNSEAHICANFKDGSATTVEEAELDGDVLLLGQSCLRPMYVRNWEPGDELRRPGHTGAEKIKTLFQEHRVLLWERRHWPVVVSGEEIVWVRGFGSAVKFRGSAQSQHTLRLIYRADFQVGE